MTRVIFFGDLAATGFGTVTMDLGRELLKAGLDVRFVSQNDLDEQLPEPFASRTFQVNDTDPVSRQLFGTNSLSMRGIGGLFDGSLWADGWTPEAGIVLGDPGNVRLVVMRDEQTKAAFRSVPVFHYVPIEGVDIPPTWREMWSIVRPVAMCRFGTEEIGRITGTVPPFVYHGVDTKVFRPITPEQPLRLQDKVLRSKADCKRAFGLDPRAKVVFRADANVVRKRYPSLLRALVPVLTRGDTYLLIHTLTFGLGGDLMDWIDKLPEPIRGRVVRTGFHDRYGAVDRNVLVALYNLADLYVSVSAEGFGLTIAEAIACGTPAIGLDYSSVPEVIGPAGEVVPIAGLIDNEYGYFWAAAEERTFGRAVAALLDDDVRRRRLGQAGPKHVRSSFSWAKAARQFAGLIRDAVPLEVAV